MSRRTWTYTVGGRPLSEPVEVTPGAEPEGFNLAEGRQPVFTDRFMEGHTTVDGVDIGSRRKRADYMRANGLAEASDFSPAFYEKKRSERLNGTFANLGQQIARNYDALSQRKRK